MTQSDLKSGPKSGVRRIPIPANLLGPTLAEIDDLAELKVILRTAALLAGQPIRRGIPPSLNLDELLDDPALQTPQDSGGSDYAIRRALAASIARGVLTAVRPAAATRIFIADADCRRYLQTAGLQPLTPDALVEHHTPAPPPQRPQSPAPPARADNIFALYERHIGPYGHQVAEQLRAAEREYPARWIEYAFATAARHDARSWSYVNTILRRLVREGLPNGTMTANEHGKPGRDTAPDSSTEYMEQYRRLFGRLPWEPGDGAPGTGAPGDGKPGG